MGSTSSGCAFIDLGCLEIPVAQILGYTSEETQAEKPLALGPGRTQGEMGSCLSLIIALINLYGFIGSCA